MRLYEVVWPPQVGRSGTAALTLVVSRASPKRMPFFYGIILSSSPFQHHLLREAVVCKGRTCKGSTMAGY
jgi:hypothetical protein